MKEIIPITDEDLMREIKADNMTAFDLIYKKYSKGIYKFGMSILKKPEEAEDLVQHVFFCLWKNRHKVENNALLKYYLFSITYNSAISTIRKKAKENRFIEYLKSQPQIGMETDKVENDYSDLTIRVESIINKLPPRQKEIYLLHKDKGLKYHEIAKRLQISVNTIETHMSRALKTIRHKLGKYSLFVFLFNAIL
jgi:RNA polymerase sigma-70 factor, ECF subfamily